MSKLLGCVLIAAGIALAGATISLAEPQDPRPAPEASLLSSTSATKPLPAQALPRPATIVVTSEATRRKPIGPFETVTIANDPAAVARALQTELRRVGCYGGEGNGVWSASSRAAMKAFMDRVNASLPVDRPDFILLSLVRAHEGTACGAPCPAGQAMNADNRCLPQAIVAKANRKPSANPVAHARALAVPGAVPSPIVRERLPDVVASSPPPSALVEPQQPFVSDTPRMSLAGPVAETEAHAAIPENLRQAQRAAERERRLAAERKTAGWGQTRWARDFFKRDGGVF